MVALFWMLVIVEYLLIGSVTVHFWAVLEERNNMRTREIYLLFLAWPLCWVMIVVFLLFGVLPFAAAGDRAEEYWR